MPIYDYRKREGAKGCPHCEDGFEERQSMGDAALAVCPRCGGPVERVISAPAIGKSNKTLLSDSNLKAHGFHRLVKEDKGRYRKTTT
jgi:putative FmdB family regulatory protein